MCVYVPKPQFVPGLPARLFYHQRLEAAIDEPILQRTKILTGQNYRYLEFRMECCLLTITYCGKEYIKYQHNIYNYLQIAKIQ